MWQSSPKLKRGAWLFHTLFTFALAATLVQTVAADFRLNDTLSVVVVKAAPIWASVLCVAGIVLAQVVHLKKRSFLAIVLIALLTVGFALSVRSLVLNAASGDLLETWAGVRVSQRQMNQVNEAGHCLKRSAFTVEIQSLNGAWHGRMFAGVWPFDFGADPLMKRFGLGQCLRLPK